MLRRAIALIVCLGLPLFAADPARDAERVLTELAASLTAGNVQTFMEPFDTAFPDYQRLRAGVAALAQMDTQSYLEVVKNEGSEQERTLEVTWELRTAEARRETKITCRLQLRNGKWRVAAFAPVDFFAP